MVCFPENLDNYKLPALLNQAIDAKNRVAGKSSNHLQNWQLHAPH